MFRAETDVAVLVLSFMVIAKRITTGFSRLLVEPATRKYSPCRFAFGRQVAFLTQLRIHSHVIEPNVAVDNQRSRNASRVAACQLPDDAAWWMVRAKNSGSNLS
jgi:hypothetical protein